MPLSIHLTPKVTEENVPCVELAFRDGDDPVLRLELGLDQVTNMGHSMIQIAADHRAAFMAANAEGDDPKILTLPQ